LDQLPNACDVERENKTAAKKKRVPRSVLSTYFNHLAFDFTVEISIFPMIQQQVLRRIFDLAGLRVSIIQQSKGLLACLVSLVFGRGEIHC